MQFILGSKSLSFVLDGKPRVINREAEIFNLALSAIRSENITKLREILDMKQTIVASVKSASQDVQIEGNRIMYGKREITGLVTTRIFEMLRGGLDGHFFQVGCKGVILTLGKENAEVEFDTYTCRGSRIKIWSVNRKAIKHENT